MAKAICKKCNKEFYPTYEWVYKDNCNMYCSWTCYNYRNERKPSTSRKVKKVELYSENDYLLKVFTSATDAAENTGYDASKIRDACREQKPYMGFKWKYRE